MSTTEVKNYFAVQMAWKQSDDPYYPYEAHIGTEKYVIRLNDFPVEHLYTLLVNGTEVISFDDWPEKWDVTTHDMTLGPNTLPTSARVSGEKRRPS